MKSCYILIFILVPLFAAAQTSLEKFKFTRIPNDIGLSNSNITSITQDSKGFLWLGTNDGINKYDGYNFKVYRQLPGDTTGLLNNSILCVFEDSRAQLWASSENGGFYFYDCKKDRFVVVPALSTNCEIYSIAEDRSQTLWATGVMNAKAFVANLDRIHNSWEYHYLFPSDLAVINIIQNNDDEYLLAIYHTGLYKWNKKTNIITEIHESGLDKTIEVMVQDNADNLWIGTRNGLSKLNLKTKIFTHLRMDFEHPENSISGAVITNLCTDGSYLWISSENGGLSKMDIRTNTFTHFKFNKNDATTISDDAIETIYKDHQNRIWVGAFSKGLCVYDKMKEKFGEFNVTLSNDVVNAIWKDKKNRLWIGTEGGLTMLHGTEVHQYIHHRDQSRSLPSNPILSIFEDSQNRLWFGTWDGGVSRYDEQHNDFINYLHDPNNASSLSNANVFSINEETATHRILVSTYSGLNVLIDEKLGKFEHHIDATKHPTSNYLNTLFIDYQGLLWIGSFNALCSYDLQRQIRTKYLFDEKTGAGTFVNCMAEDAKQTLWIGTNKGLFGMRNNAIVENYTIINGLPNDIVNGILIDHHDFLWLSTTNGMSKFDPKTKKFTNYDVNDGLISNEFKPNACYKNVNGQFFIASRGVNMFYPDSIKTNPHIPSVYITGIKIFNKMTKIGDANGILQQNISETQEITLKPEFNFFSIEYVGLNFTSSKKNQYAYQLEGFDEDWVNIGTQRFATFTNLDPGTYTFRVKASNNDGLWNAEGASLIIQILPPWWATWWFRMLGILLILFGGYGFYHLRVRLIKKSNTKLSDLVKERTNELLDTNKELMKRENEVASQNIKLIEQGKQLQETNIALVKRDHEVAAQNKKLTEQGEELNTYNDALQNLNESLEQTVQIRTHELTIKNKKLAEYAFINAHNLRVPVANIKGLIQLFEIDRSKEEILELLVILKGQSEKLDTVLYDIKYMLEQDELLEKDNNSSLQAQKEEN